MSTDRVLNDAAPVSRRWFLGGCTAALAGVVLAACGGDDAAQPVAEPATGTGSNDSTGAPGVTGSTVDAGAGSNAAGDGPRLDGLSIDVRRDPGCGCCLSWVSYAEELGASVTVSEDAKRFEYRAKVGIPEEASSCHTGVVEGYALEGHVPAEAIRKMLDDKPDAAGIAVPGMPGDSPGMGGDPTTWAAQKVVLVGTDGSLTDFAY